MYKSSVNQIVFLLAGVCILMLALTGCGRYDHIFETSQTKDTEKEDITKLVVTYQTLPTSILEDLEEVTAAINEITREEIGAEIEFRIVDATDAFTEYPLWISRDEQIDLMMLNYQDITTYISRGMLTKLDELFQENGQYILSLMEEGYYVTEGSVVKGHAYGVAVVSESSGSGTGIWVPAALIEETGFLFDEKHVYTMSELSAFFRACKELYPDTYPLGQITSSNTYSAYAYYGGQLDGLGSDTVSGILVEDGRIADFFETEGYQEFLHYMRQWYEAGYIYPDAAFTDSYTEELIANGLVLSCPSSSEPGFNREDVFGEKTVCLRTSQVKAGHQYSKSGFWTIPVTSADPEAAMKFLNLMYEDQRIANLIQYGLPSRHYVVLDVNTGRISYPYGVSRQSVGYYNPLGLYGDRRKMYTFDTKELQEAKKAYAAEAMENREEFNDFCFETEQVNLELSAVQKVIEKYVPVLESGCVDTDTYYQEFIMQLKLAGIDRIIAEKQRQYDEWKK